MLQIFTDTDCDFTFQKAKECGFHLISMPYTVDNQTIYPYKDSNSFEYKKYYDMLRDGVIPTTGAISYLQYIEYFEPYFKNGDEIIYIHFSHNMTQTFDEMEIAIKQLKTKYPEAKFYHIDTMAIVTLSYLIVDEFAKQVKKGLNAEELVQWANNEVQHYATYFFADNLKFFKHSGRVSNIAALMGNLIGIRPIIHISEQGRMESIDKERGRFNAMNKLLYYMDEYGDDVLNHKIIIGHTDSPEMVEEFKELLFEKYGKNIDIDIVYCNPTCGAHCGPDGLSVAFHAKHR